MEQVVSGQVQIAEDFQKDSRSEGFLAMYGNRSFPAIGVFDAMMAAFDSNDCESDF